jgi:hypothetical protein
MSLFRDRKSEQIGHSQLVNKISILKLKSLTVVKTGELTLYPCYHEPGFNLTVSPEVSWALECASRSPLAGDCQDGIEALGVIMEMMVRFSQVMALVFSMVQCMVLEMSSVVVGIATQGAYFSPRMVTFSVNNPFSPFKKCFIYIQCTGQAATDVPERLFAVVGIGEKEISVRLNFGTRPFVYQAEKA